MHLSWKDGVSTLLGAAAVAVTLSVVLGWGWPMLADYRVAAVVLWALGVAMCPVAWAAVRAAAGDEAARSSLRRRLGLGTRYYNLMSALGLVATALLVAALIAPVLVLFLALALTVLVMWAVTTGRHAAPGRPRRRVSA